MHLWILRRPALNQLEQIAQVRHGVSNLVREIGDEPAGGGKAVALHQVRLQRDEPRVPFGERFVRFAQLGHLSGERRSHLAELLGDPRSTSSIRDRGSGASNEPRAMADAALTVRAPAA